MAESKPSEPLFTFLENRFVPLVCIFMCCDIDATPLQDYRAFSPSVQHGEELDWNSVPSIQDYPIQSAFCLPASGTTVDRGSWNVIDNWFHSRFIRYFFSSSRLGDFSAFWASRSRRVFLPKSGPKKREVAKSLSIIFLYHIHFFQKTAR